MRKLLCCAISLVATSVSVAAQPAKDVNVINTPGVTVENTPGVTIENAEPVPVSIVDGGGNGAQTIIEYRVVGFTTTTPDGSVETVDANGVTVLGYRAMDQLCKDEVAANARAASVAEYVHSTDVPEPAPVTGAWVIPTEIRAIFRPDISDDSFDWTVTDNLGHLAGQQSAAAPSLAISANTCNRYQTASGVGYIGIALGRVDQSGCNNERPVACSVPVAIQVTQ